MLRFLLLLSVWLSATVSADPVEVYWEDLKPADFIVEENVDHSGAANVQQNLAAPVITRFNGKEVKVPGFVVPLEGNETHFTEILLVPYFGACIHVPPPPANQIIYVKFDQPVEISSLYDPVWVVGILSTEQWQGELATTGYTLQGSAVELYQ